MRLLWPLRRLRWHWLGLGSQALHDDARGPRCPRAHRLGRPKLKLPRFRGASDGAGAALARSQRAGDCDHRGIGDNRPGREAAPNTLAVGARLTCGCRKAQGSLPPPTQVSLNVP